MNVQAGLQDGRRQVGMWKPFSDYSRSIIIMIGGTMVAYYPAREDITKHASGLYSLLCPSLLWLAFLAGFMLLLLTYCLLHGHFSERLYKAATILVCITSFLSMLISVSFLLLLNRSYFLVTILLLLVLAAATFASYYGVQDYEIAVYEGRQKEMLKQFYDLSAQVTSAGFGGMIATSFGYLKKLPKDVHRVDFKLSEVFIVLTVISGLLVMLFTTVPPSRSRPDHRSRYVTLIGSLMYPLFGLLALTGLAVAAEFSVEFFFLTSFPILFSVGVWFRKEFLQEEDGTSSQAHRATGHENEPDTPSMSITTLIFTTFITVYGLYYGSERNDDSRPKICMFLLSCAFMSSLCRMMPLFKRPGTQSLAMAAMILTYSTIVSSSLSVFFFFLR